MADNNGWMARAKATAKALLSISDVVGTPGGFDGELARAEGLFGNDYVSVSMLLGSGKRQARSRQEIYQKMHYMLGDAIISTALRAHVVMALGGDERSGDVIFFNTTPDAETDQKKKTLVAELKADLEAMFNRVAHQTAFNACGFGDSYSRIYSQDEVGVVEICTDEMVYPPLVQPYSRGTRTVGYVVSTGSKFTERLTVQQIARAKMPRMLYVAQVRVLEKSMRTAIAEDDIEKLPLLPDLVGGSFLESVEEAYDNLAAALNGLVGQRILSSIDESMIGVNLEGMTLQQRQEFLASIKAMLQASKDYAAEAVKRGKPVTERRWHLIPTFGDKQVSQIGSFSNTSGASSISIEDVMFHAKLLAGALGTDLSMLGFADLLSGGFGDGGFARTSVQVAERARIIRNALQSYFHEIVDIHTLKKYGWVFDPKDRPYQLSFAGSISSLEAEEQASREKAMNTSALTLTSLQMLRDLKMGEEATKHFMENEMGMDEDTARLLAKSLQQAIDEAAKAEADAAGDAGGGGRPGGGFGGFGS